MKKLLVVLLLILIIGAAGWAISKTQKKQPQVSTQIGSQELASSTKTVERKYYLDVCIDTPTVHINSEEVDGYVAGVDCNFKPKPYINGEEFYFIKNKKTNDAYYFPTNNTTVGGVSIVGKKDNFLFYKLCYEGCGEVYFFEILERGGEVVYPESISFLNRQGLPEATEMIIQKNRVFFVGEHDIYELDTKDFSFKKIKTISKDKFFGLYSEAYGYWFVLYKKTDKGIIFNTYTTSQEYDHYGKEQGTFLLEI